MRIPQMIGTAALALLAACGTKPTESGAGANGANDVSPSIGKRIAAGAADLPRPQAGLYRTTVEMVEFDIPGAPAGASDMMRGSMGKSSTSEYCLKPEDVEKGYKDVVRRGQKGDCTFERFDAVGGKIDAEMTCKTAQGGASHVTMSGTTGPTSSDMDTTMTLKLPGLGDGTMRMKSKSERIGPCP